MSTIEMKDLGILVVDDNEPMRLLLRKHLGDLGIGTVRTAVDGMEALKLIAEQRPDLIITDQQMERLDGLHFVWELRTSSDPKLKDIPVIMMTAYTAAELLQEAVKAGIDDFLAKPISKETLSERILMVLSKINRQEAARHAS
ncbi:MAG: response regulator [Planctomycetota bacterium]|jgi:two-component system chemotaxis response regulator CheY